MSATGIVTQRIGEYQYRVASEVGIDVEFTGYSISKESLTIGERVRIIDVYSGIDDMPRYGFARENSGLRGVIAIPDGQKGGFAEQSPANFTAAYIAYYAGKVQQFYDIGRVMEVMDSSNLRVIMLTGDFPYAERIMPCSGVFSGSFVRNDIALIRRGAYRNCVVGWWRPFLDSKLFLIGYRYAYHFINDEFKEYALNPTDSSIVAGEAIYDGKRSVYLPIRQDFSVSVESAKKLCIKYDIFNRTLTDIYSEVVPTNSLVTSGGAKIGNKIILTPGWANVANAGGGTDRYGVIDLSTDSFTWSASVTNKRCGVKHAVIGRKIYSTIGDKIAHYDTDTGSVTYLTTIPSVTIPAPFVDMVPWFYVIAKIQLNKIVLLPRDTGYPKIGVYDIDSNTYADVLAVDPDATQAGTCAAYGNKIYFIGQDGFLLRVYDAENNIMTAEKTMPVFSYNVFKINETELMIYGEKIFIYNIVTKETKEYNELSSAAYLSSWGTV